LLSRRKVFLPTWLYEAWPFLYIATGTWLNFRVAGPLGPLGGALLVFAGLHVLYLRWTYRRSAAVKVNHELAMMSLVWDSSRECEHEIIDSDHRELFAASHQLVAAASAGCGEAVDTLIRDLIFKVEAHNRREEHILQHSSPAVAAEHRLEHEAQAAKLGALYRGYLAGRVRRHELVECLVYEAIVEHTKRDKMAIQKAFWD
jgi:hemerythrin-like metal-binding protein